MRCAGGIWRRPTRCAHWRFDGLLLQQAHHGAIHRDAPLQRSGEMRDGSNFGGGQGVAAGDTISPSTQLQEMRP